MKKYLIFISIVFLLFSVFATIKLSIYYYVTSYLFTALLLFITFVELISNDDVDIYNVISNEKISDIARGIVKEEKIFNEEITDDELWQERELFWQIFLEDKLNDL